MGKASDLIQDTRVHLDGATRGVLNELSSALDTTTSTFTLARIVGPVSPGAVLSIGLEDMYVWGYTQANNQVIVRRAHNGTPALTHLAGDLVRVNPRFTDAAIFTALNQAMSALTSTGLYNPTEIQRTYTYLQTGLDLATDMVDDQLLQVTYQDLSGLRNWIEVSGYQVRVNLLNSDYLSGRGLFLDKGLPTGVSVRITYKATLKTLANLTDDVVTVTGLNMSAIDLPPLWVALKLLAGQAASRANPNYQPAGRRPDEVSTSDMVTSMRGLQMTYTRRLNEEIRTLRTSLPARERRFRL